MQVLAILGENESINVRINHSGTVRRGNHSRKTSADVGFLALSSETATALDALRRTLDYG
jgi:hypothetical protein